MSTPDWNAPGMCTTGVHAMYNRHPWLFRYSINFVKFAAHIAGIASNGGGYWDSTAYFRGRPLTDLELPDDLRTQRHVNDGIFGYNSGTDSWGITSAVKTASRRMQSFSAVDKQALVRFAILNSKRTTACVEQARQRHLDENLCYSQMIGSTGLANGIDVD